jgi:hypothetical protein
MRVNNELVKAIDFLVLIATAPSDSDTPTMPKALAVALIDEINNSERDFEMMFKMCNVLADMSDQFRKGGEAVGTMLRDCEQALQQSRAAHLAAKSEAERWSRMVDENLTKISDQNKLLGAQSVRIHTLEAEVDRLTAMTGIEVDELPQAGPLEVGDHQ